ncbi:MAG: hypothetical protein JW870_16755 [Candidatus Delongbacteria bacterium]|nr:hypothetical protein [Candidatus Delongbacteria bacterium]
MKKNVILILFISVFFVFLITINSTWQYDDIPVILKNSNLRIRSLSEIFNFGWHRFISMSSFALNFYFFGEDLRSFYITNLVIHFINSVIVYFLSMEIFTLNKLNSKLIQLFGLFVAFLWALAPINVQGVFYIVQRMSSLGALFFLLALLLYFKFRKRNNLKLGTKIFYNFGIFVSFICAIISKENTFMLPFIILLSEWIFFRDGSKKFLIQTIAYSLFFSIPILFFLYFKMNSGIEGLNVAEILNNEYPHRDFTPLARVLVEPRILLLHISQIIFPFVGRFHLTYDFDWINAKFQVWTYLSILIILVTIVFSFMNRKKHPVVFFGVFFFLICHIPESSIVGLHLIFEHRNYLPSIGIFIIIVYLYQFYASKYKYSQAILVIFIVFSGLNFYLLSSKYEESYCNAYYDYMKEYKANSYDGASIFIDKLFIEEKDYIFSNVVISYDFFVIENNRSRSKLLKQYISGHTRIIGLYYLNNYLATSDSDFVIKKIKKQVLYNSAKYSNDMILILKHIYVSTLLKKYDLIDNNEFARYIFKSEFQRQYYPLKYRDKFKSFIFDNIKRLNEIDVYIEPYMEI